MQAAKRQQTQQSFHLSSTDEEKSMPNKVFYAPCASCLSPACWIQLLPQSMNYVSHGLLILFYFPDTFPSVCLQIQGVLVGGLAYFIRGGIPFRGRADRYSLNLNCLLWIWKHGGYNCKATSKAFKIISARLSFCPFMPETFCPLYFVAASSPAKTALNTH